jgi:crossover junction endodeoxyribonuclease RusA
MISLDLPWPPSLNHYYRRVGARTLISRTGRQYRTAMIALLHRQFTQPLLGRLQVTICAHPPDRRRRDLDNIQKALLDALQHAGVYADDCQIDSLTVHRCNPVPDGRIRLSLVETTSPNLGGEHP